MKTVRHNVSPAKLRPMHSFNVCTLKRCDACKGGAMRTRILKYIDSQMEQFAIGSAEREEWFDAWWEIALCGVNPIHSRDFFTVPTAEVKSELKTSPRPLRRRSGQRKKIED